MTQTRTFLFLSALMIALGSTACQRGDGEGQAITPEPSSEATSAGSTAAEVPAPTGSEEVAYEPAYPDDVSSEGLSDEDLSQHGAEHSHGGEEHSHDDGSHTHGEGETHGDHDH